LADVQQSGQAPVNVGPISTHPGAQAEEDHEVEETDVQEESPPTQEAGTPANAAAPQSKAQVKAGLVAQLTKLGAKRSDFWRNIGPMAKRYGLPMIKKGQSKEDLYSKIAEMRIEEAIAEQRQKDQADE
jgi:hypothetical protein